MSKRHRATDQDAGTGADFALQAQNQRLRCAFCGLGADEVSRLFEGRHRDYICDECVEVCVRLLADFQELNVKPPGIRLIRVPWYRRILRRERSWPTHCSFCGLPQTEGQRLLTGAQVQICEICLRACNAIRTGTGLVL
jgi:hypothetical protein